MKFFKRLGVVLILIMLTIICFYYWAGSPTINNDQYYGINQYGSPSKNGSDTIKIMTYNIGYLSGMTNNLPVSRSAALLSDNLSKTIAFLRGQNADIIAFQEIDFNAKRSKYINQLDSLANKTNYPFSAKAINWDKSYVPFPYWPIKYHFGKVVSGQGILSKMQIVKQQVKVLEKPITAPFYYNKFYLDRLVQLAFLKVNELDTLIIMNTHLEAFDKETREAQSEVVWNLFKKLALQFPVILLGDFNARPPLSEDKVEMESTLVNFFSSKDIGEAIEVNDYLANKERFYTFDSRDPYERLDYIFYTSDRIEKVAAGVALEAGEISDHLPVWMTFILKK